MKKDIFITLGVQIFVMISVLLTYKLAMSYFGQKGFAEYSLIKRNVSLISPLLLMGLGSALTRYIAISVENRQKINDYFLSGLFFMLLFFLLVWILLIIFPYFISLALYGSKKYINFLMPMFISLVGLSMHVLVYSYFRGNLNMTKANLLQLTSLGILPLFGFYFADKVVDIYYYSGLMTILFLLPIIIYIIYMGSFMFSNIFKNARVLLMYGIQRVPGDFGVMALFSLPVLVATHKFGVEMGGYVAFGIALLNMSGQAVAPLGVIFLPKISQLIAKKEFKIINVYVKKLFILSLLLSSFTLFVFYIFAEDILSLYLGYINKDILKISKIISVGMIAFMMYVTLRGVIDAYYEKGINTINILIGLFLAIVVYVGLYFINNLQNMNSILYSFLFGLFIITGLTLYIVYKSLRVSK